VQGTGDEMDADDGENEGSNWLVSLAKKVETMIERLPGQLDTLPRSEASIQNPLFRFLEREVIVASKLLDSVRADLLAVLELCKGERKLTNVLKQMSEDLHGEIIPKRWRRYIVQEIPVTQWIIDFVKRVEQLKRLSDAKDFGQSGLWYGGLLFPEAYLTATRQAVAQNNNWSLEDVVLSFQIGMTDEQLENNPQGFILTGFTMQGAEYDKDNDRFKMTEKIST
jgi:dynein heavy chain 1